MEGRSWTVHLLGYPAAGKRTVGAAHVDTHRVFEPDDPLLLRLDTTHLAPSISAHAILEHLDAIAGTR